jgi:hypothetical protein
MIPQWVLLISPFVGFGVVALGVAVISSIDADVVQRAAESRDNANYDELVRKTADTLGRGVVTIIRQNLVPASSVAEHAQRQTVPARDDVQTASAQAQYVAPKFAADIDRSGRKLAELERAEAERAAMMRRAQWALASYQPTSTDETAKAADLGRDSGPPLLAGHMAKSAR